MDQRHGHRCANARQQSQPHGPGDGRHRRRQKRRCQHFALQADIKNARAFRHQPGQAGQKQRCR